MAVSSTSQWTGKASVAGYAVNTRPNLIYLNQILDLVLVHTLLVPQYSHVPTLSMSTLHVSMSLEHVSVILQVLYYDMEKQKLMQPTIRMYKARPLSVRTESRFPPS